MEFSFKSQTFTNKLNHDGKHNSTVNLRGNILEQSDNYNKAWKFDVNLDNKGWY